jgi:hypothetical protein
MSKNGSCSKLRAQSFFFFYLMIFTTRPAPTVRPPSRIANLRPSSIAIDFPNTTVISGHVDEGSDPFPADVMRHRSDDEAFHLHWCHGHQG